MSSKTNNHKNNKNGQVGQRLPKSKLFIYKKWHKAFCGIAKDEKE